MRDQTGRRTDAVLLHASTRGAGGRVLAQRYAPGDGGGEVHGPLESLGVAPGWLD